MMLTQVLESPLANKNKSVRRWLYRNVEATRWVPSVKWQLQRVRHPLLIKHSQDYWTNLKDKYKGQRGFVIGNGPSLKYDDLTALKGEISIAANRIYLAYEHTDWRPTLVSCADALVWAKYGKEICKHADQVVLSGSRSPAAGVLDRIVMLRNLGPCLIGEKGFSFDMRVGTYSGWTITYVNMQIAAHMGLNPIYLIGCDHFYKGETNVDQNLPKNLVHAGAPNHFHPAYRTAGEVVSSAPVERMEAAYTVARDQALAAGFQIFNATRGGHLEVFPRKSLDEVLGKSAVLS